MPVSSLSTAARAVFFLILQVSAPARRFMIIKVLGSAAGGGFPQWNCNGRNSAAVRMGREGFRARTQSSIAVSANGSDWVLFNASPDLRKQINDTPELHPRPAKGLRDSPIQAVVLTNGDVDHVAGLLNLREGQKFKLYATNRVLQTLESNSIFNVLARDKVERIELSLGSTISLAGPDGALGLDIEIFPVPGKVALYLENPEAGENFGTQQEDTVGVRISSGADRSFFYLPGCAFLDDALRARLRSAALILFDGTLFTNDEMVRQNLLDKTGQRMGHISMSGPDGSMAAFSDLDVARKIYIHINNSNPVLDENSSEREAVKAAGWDVSFDGMEVRM